MHAGSALDGSLSRLNRIPPKCGGVQAYYCELMLLSPHTAAG